MLLLDFTKILLAPGRRGVLRYPCKRAAGPLWDLVPSAPPTRKEVPHHAHPPMPIRLFHHCPVGKGGRLAPPARPKKGWQFTHLTAGVFYHFAACPPEDVVYHLEYQDQKDLEAEPLQSLRRRGVGLCGPVHPVLLLPQARQGHLPRRRPPSLQNPAAQLGMVRRVFWGRMFPLFPLVGGVFLPQFVLTRRWTAPWPSSLPWCWWPMGPSFSSSPGSISWRAGRFSPACLPRPTAGGDAPRKTGVLYHIASRATARGRVFPWRPAPSCIAVSKTLHFSRFSPVVFQQFLPSPTVRLPLES